MKRNIVYSLLCIIADPNKHFVAGTWIGSLMILAAAGIIAYIAGMETTK
jgi:hypothetical protein